MNKFGFNINLKMTPEHIKLLGETMLGTGLYEAIEVTYYENMEHVDTKPYNSAVKEIAEAWHPQVTVHIPAFNPTEESSTIRAAILHEAESCLDYTKSLGGREMIMHSGYLHMGHHVPAQAGGKESMPADKKVWNLSVEMMKRVCDLAAERGMTVYTENLSKRELTVTCADLNRYLCDVGRDNLGIVFDIGHSFYTGNEIPKEVRTAGKNLKHLHLHDNGGRTDEHLSLGEGKIDYDSFCRALKDVEYKGLYMMELGYCTPENLKSSREIIRKLVQNNA